MRRNQNSSFSPIRPTVPAPCSIVGKVLHFDLTAAPQLQLAVSEAQFFSPLPGGIADLSRRRAPLSPPRPAEFRANPHSSLSFSYFLYPSSLEDVNSLVIRGRRQFV